MICIYLTYTELLTRYLVIIMKLIVGMRTILIPNIGMMHIIFTVHLVTCITLGAILNQQYIQYQYQRMHYEQCEKRVRSHSERPHRGAHGICQYQEATCYFLMSSYSYSVLGAISSTGKRAMSLALILRWLTRLIWRPYRWSGRSSAVASGRHTP